MSSDKETQLTRHEAYDTYRFSPNASDTTKMRSAGYHDVSREKRQTKRAFAERVAAQSGPLQEVCAHYHLPARSERSLPAIKPHAPELRRCPALKEIDACMSSGDQTRTVTLRNSKPFDKAASSSECGSRDVQVAPKSSPSPSLNRAKQMFNVPYGQPLALTDIERCQEPYFDRSVERPGPQRNGKIIESRKEDYPSLGEICGRP